jgi:hypothetical protein
MTAMATTDGDGGNKCSGYMSPEYAMEGVFSVKSDVFSFRVLVLEIVSGRKNRGMYRHGSGEHSSLLGHVSSQITDPVCLCACQEQSIAFSQKKKNRGLPC